jgi:hypothetical protein
MDIVEAALVDYQEENGEKETKWTIYFINTEKRKGDLEALGGNNYVLRRTGSEKPYYFSADKVVFLFPDK